MFTLDLEGILGKNSELKHVVNNVDHSFKLYHVGRCCQPLGTNGPSKKSVSGIATSDTSGITFCRAGGSSAALVETWNMSVTSCPFGASLSPRSCWSMAQKYTESVETNPTVV